MDKINDTYGEYVITPALMMGLEKEVVDRIAFGNVKELEELYSIEEVIRLVRPSVNRFCKISSCAKWLIL
jgi:hypothetical protein